MILARLGDSEAEVTGSDFNERWRRFLACLNLYQFSDNFRFWTSSAGVNGDAPDIPLQAAETVSEEWQLLLNEVTPSLRWCVQELAAAGLPTPAALPKVEYFNDQIDDDAFAELAWPHGVPPVAVLAGDQIEFTKKWQDLGWKIFVPDDIQARGTAYLIDHLMQGVAGA